MYEIERILILNIKEVYHRFSILFDNQVSLIEVEKEL